MELDFSILLQDGNLPLLLKGLWVTIRMTFFALCISCMIGLLVGIGGMSKNKLISGICATYLAWFRGTPLLVQLVLLYYGLAISLQIDLTASVAGVLGLGMYSGAYVSEIVRGSIQSIDQGQMEAGRSLGMSHWQTMGKVILPQAVRRMLPPLANEFIALTKNSSLLSVITVPELMRAGNSIVADNFKYFEIYLTIALFYFVVNFVISTLIRILERKLHVGGVRT
ncbi:amino acid ABC transporter membrane protein, PAAT family [Seinonella peptonophila]|uniref:Amino acid ABC transporter membrane protein, PAAT family n=1 Tax=Seinonella peptonophila TaxID=112248 RepID=A0A1M4U2E0_9BACL|nr:amino acid ABC transporter permease [Seinonella peptonophila]SHE50922.1 amino acid ABC transporter membrane protein, PAAT family [Seinonella peptonophila]